jgi:PPP family 3-phenylpropionic acid transporter
VNSPAPSGAYFSLRLSAFFATLGIATGIGMPFIPVWLDYKGLTPQEIGVALAGPMVMRMIFVPLITRLADRFNVLRGAIIITSIGSIAGHVVLASVDGFFAIAGIIALVAVFYTPTYPLADAYALRGLAERGKAYGPVRLWSSAAFIVANVCGGAVIGWLTRPSIIWLITASYVTGAVLAWLLIPLPRHRDLSGEEQPAQKSLWRLPAFALVLLACALIQSSHAVYYGFSTLDWTRKGLSDTTIGVLWAIGVIAEVCLFAASAFINRLISPIALILLGAFGGIVRWTLMAFDPPFYLLPLLQCLHALTFCATHIGAMQFVTHVVPPGRAASAQGDLSASQSVVFAGAMGMSGILFNAYGDLAYGAMVLLAAAGAAVAFAAYSTWRDPHKDRTLAP